MQTSKNLEYLNPEISKVLENLTKYVSKPLGFNKIYNEEQIKKRGKNRINLYSFLLYILNFILLFKRSNMPQVYHYK